MLLSCHSAKSGTDRHRELTASVGSSAIVATQNHQVAGAGLQFGLAVPVRRSFQLTH